MHEVHRPPAPVLRYVDQVTGGEKSDIEFRFSRGVLTEFDVDVVHVADPYLDVLLGTKGAGPVQRLLATMALTRNLRKHNIALVRTLPGTDGSQSGQRAGSLARRLIDRATAAFIVFDEVSPTPDQARTHVVPHADFRDRFLGYPQGEMCKGRVLSIARDRLPSAAAALVGIPRATETAGVTMRLAGGADGPLEVLLNSARARHPHLVSLRLERLSDGAQVQEIDQAELVVVPEVTSLADLQTIFMALSRERPVLVSRAPQLESIASEIGATWIHFSDGPVTAASVDEALSLVRARTTREPPHLGRRSLAAAHVNYANVFQEVAKRVPPNLHASG